MNYINDIKQLFIIVIFFAIACTSCKKIIEVPPPTNIITGKEVFHSDATATSAVVAIYGEMMNGPSYFSAGGLTLYTGLCADELYFYSTGPRDEFQKNDISLTGQSVIENNFWNLAYRLIYAANSCASGIENSVAMSAEMKNRLLGEVKFARAFCYFYLVNLFGDVPLITSADYKTNIAIPRIAATTVYEQITSDLSDAISLLPESYTSVDRIRPNKWAAASLLARVYLYLKDWEQAEASAAAVINSANYMLTTNPAQVFLKTSKETIWQLQPVNPSLNTYEANQILPATANSLPTYLLTQDLINSFETGDLRKTNWTTARTYLGQTLYYPTKYKVYGNNAPVTEYYVVLRLAEMYLIRAEANAKQGSLSEALADLNIIRARAGLSNSAATSLTSILAEIEFQRKFEYFSEWGHRWFDLKRTERSGAILGALKPATWQSTDTLWPIPSGQILANPLLVQNPGY